MATLKDTKQSMLDSAIGPVIITTNTYTGFDVDDFTHTTLISQAVKLQLKRLAENANPELANNRDRVIIDNVEAGGYGG